MFVRRKFNVTSHKFFPKGFVGSMLREFFITPFMIHLFVSSIFPYGHHPIECDLMTLLFFINCTLLHLDSAEALNTFKLLKIVIINFSCLYRFWIIFSPSTSHLHMVRENGGNWQHSYNNGSFPIIFTHFMY